MNGRLFVLLFGGLPFGALPNALEGVEKAGPKPEKIESQRLALEKQVRSLLSLGVAAHERKDFPGAAADFTKALDLAQKLYPEEEFPRGHPDLALSLYNVGSGLRALGTKDKALPYFEQALAMRQKLYPETEFPQGHSSLATSLSSLGFTHRELRSPKNALTYYEQALAMQRKLFPEAKYPKGDPQLAGTLSSIGAVQESLGFRDKALNFYEQALGMNLALYPEEAHSKGRPEIAWCLDDLGSCHAAMGGATQALSCYEKALAMRRTLYSEKEYPQGHPALAASLHRMGWIHNRLRAREMARTYYEQALAMRQKLYPKERFPQGHSDLAQTLHNLGMLMVGMEDLKKAQTYFEQALAMRQTLFPKETYPKGHSDLAYTLHDLGWVLNRLDEPKKALLNYEKALAIRKSLYPEDEFPTGHPDLAQTLHNLGLVMENLEDLAKARTYFEQALAMRQLLFPKEQYPKGHSDLAFTLHNLGSVLYRLDQSGKALPYYEQALAIRQNLYPNETYPKGHRDLAQILYDLGLLMEDLGAPQKALPYHEQALAMRQKLYTKVEYPGGHSDIAWSMNHLADVLSLLGASEKALPYYEQTLAMRQSLYPMEEFPKGHEDLATSLADLGFVLQALGAAEKGLPFAEQAVEMYRKLYPEEEFPRGDPGLSSSLNVLAVVLHTMGSQKKALLFYEQSLAMDRKLYPEKEYPKGLFQLAVSLGNLGNFHQEMGNLKQALAYYEQALDMREKLYPRLFNPLGHPFVAMNYYQIAMTWLSLGEVEKARANYDEALEMWRSLFEAGLVMLAENEALDALNSLLPFLDSYFTMTISDSSWNHRAYSVACDKKRALFHFFQMRALPARFALLEKTSGSEKLRADWQEWLGLRRQIDQFRDLYKGGKERAGALLTLTAEAERLERKLMTALPRLKENPSVAKDPKDLLQALPKDAVLIDFLRYTHIDFDPKTPGLKGEKRTPSYVVFLSAGGKLKRIELGPAEPIDIEATLWHRAVQSWKPSLPREERADLESQAARAAQNLSRLLWKPVAKQLPEGTRTLYLAPDGELGRIPWAALPLDNDRILIEDYVVALVPHGPFLLQQLERKARAPEKDGVLVLGGVEYGGKSYTFLKGTKEELDLVGALAKEMGKSITPLSGPEAMVKRLREELPLARFAHLSTHGFFDEASYAEELKRQERHQEALRKGYVHDKDRLTIGALGSRNTLAFVGLVLAGAGKPEGEDKGILTGTAILELPLDMDLAVLTACETGLGARSGAEGVQGLQRAFHVAGCRNVIASLWKVDDKATVALMAKFYHELWRNKKSPLDALREAQLTLYRHPELIPALAGERGPPAFDKAVAVPVTASLPTGTTRTPTRLWAGFVLSGLGR